MRKINLQETLPKILNAKGYSGSRKIICAEVGISTSALAQYISGKSKPSLDVLVSLASTLDVKLDYLVFGESDVTSEIIEANPMEQYLDLALAQNQVKANQHYWTFTKMTQEVMKHIEEASNRIIRESANTSFIPGVITDEETMVLESFALKTHVATMNLNYDIIETDNQYSTSGRFLNIVANNLLQGREYYFLLPNHNRQWSNIVFQFIDLLIKKTKNESVVINNCNFRTIDSYIPSGFGLYEMDIRSFKRHDPILFEKIRNHINDENQIGYVIPPSKEMLSDMIMDLEHLDLLVSRIDSLWKQGKDIIVKDRI